MYKHFTILFVLAFILACGGSQDSSTPSEEGAKSIPDQDTEAVEENTARSDDEKELIKKGMDAVRLIQGKLQMALEGAIGSGGTEHAIQFCSVEAFNITITAGAELEVEVKRISEKYRSLQNAPLGGDSEILQSFEREMKHGKPSAVRMEGFEDGTMLYYPIVISNPLCLKCHGDPATDIDAATLAKINEIYPDDKATGYAMGDFRGAWQVLIRPQH